MDEMTDRSRAAELREKAHRLTMEADEAARDVDRQHEIHSLVDEAQKAEDEADALDPPA